MKLTDIGALGLSDLMANLFGIFVVLFTMLIGMVQFETAMQIDAIEKGLKKSPATSPGPETPVLEIASGQHFVFHLKDDLVSEAGTVDEAKQILREMHPASLVMKINAEVATGITRQLMVLCQEMGIRMFWGSEPQGGRR